MQIQFAVSYWLHICILLCWFTADSTFNSQNNSITKSWHSLVKRFVQLSEVFALKAQLGWWRLSQRLHFIISNFQKVTLNSWIKYPYSIVQWNLILFFFWTAALLCQEFGCAPCMKMHEAWNKVSLNCSPTWPDSKCLSGKFKASQVRKQHFHAAKSKWI